MQQIVAAAGYELSGGYDLMFQWHTPAHIYICVNWGAVYSQCCWYSHARSTVVRSSKVARTSAIATSFHGVYQNAAWACCKSMCGWWYFRLVRRWQIGGRVFRVPMPNHWRLTNKSDKYSRVSYLGSFLSESVFSRIYFQNLFTRYLPWYRHSLCMYRIT